MSPSPGLDIRFFAAPAAFADCFSAIYRLEIALPEGESVSDLLLPEWGNLRFISAGSPGGVELDGQHFGAGSFFATGPTSRAKRISVGAIRLWGIGLLPLGWANFVRAPASQLADGVFDGARHPAFAHFARCLAALEQVEGDDLAEYAVLCEALAELARPPRDEARIRNAQQAMADPYLTQIPDFADRTGVSVRSNGFVSSISASVPISCCGGSGSSAACLPSSMAARRYGARRSTGITTISRTSCANSASLSA